MSAESRRFLTPSPSLTARLVSQLRNEIVGGKLREMMPWIKAHRIVDKTKN